MLQTNVQGYKVSAASLEKVQTHIFKKEEGTWYIHLPEYLQQGWSKKDLEMTEGADKLLNTIANGRNRVTLRLSTEPFDGADVLNLLEHCEAPKGGAVYLLDTCQGKQIRSSIWICDIALFVFGDMPEHIYFQRVTRTEVTQKVDAPNSISN